MKLIPAFCMFVLMLSVACKKSNNQPNTPPPITDTTKPPVVKADTSTLLKSVWYYFLDGTGTVATDSSHEEWTYDNQRRIVQQSTGSSVHVDTFFYTYYTDRYIDVFHAYNNGALSSISSGTYYQHAKDRTDSILGIGTGYGVEAGQTDTSAIYFYYNQNGLDSLKKVISRANTGPQPDPITRYYYTGQNLDSTISRNSSNGLLNLISYYSNGNHTGDKWYYLNGSQGGAAQYSYSNIPVGGLNVLLGGSLLPSGTLGYLISTNTTNTETDSWQFDSANRVSVRLINTNGHNTQKWVFTYY
jgi:hypothetical protein